MIDAATWEALDPAARRDFERHAAIEIRGRKQVQDLYTLPLGTVQAHPH